MDISIRLRNNQSCKQKMESEILDVKTGDYYEVARGFFGGLKLIKTWDGNTPNVRRHGTSGIIFDEAHINTKLRLPKKTPLPLTSQPKTHSLRKKAKKDD